MTRIITEKEIAGLRDYDRQLFVGLEINEARKLAYTINAMNRTMGSSERVPEFGGTGD